MPKRMRGMQREVWIAQHFARQKHHVCFAGLYYLVGLGGGGYQAYSAGQYACFAYGFGKLNLVAWF